MTEVVVVDGGDVDPSGLVVGIAVAGWNASITESLLEGATGALEEIGVGEVRIVRVPGSLELGAAARLLAEGGCDAVVALGAIVRGETDHYEVVVRESARALTLVVDRFGVPVANGILAVHDISHAIDRTGPGPANKGNEAALAAVVAARVIAAGRSLPA